ncbi:MAG: hypothetical protein OXN89_06695 [Bryobacterales bacterium]|nr:hypothetical protein [Bryobacterales bacterium]
MPRADTHPLHRHVPFLYEMVISLLEAVVETLDPVLQAIDGFRELWTNQDGRPATPDHVARKLAGLPPSVAVRHVGACVSATTNLGLAYVHSFRVLSFLSRSEDVLPSNTDNPHLAKLFDVLRTAGRETLCQVYNQVGAHDFETELCTGQFSKEAGDEIPSNGRHFHSALAY